MFAEYEKAQLMERYRRGKAHRARTGSVKVLPGALFGQIVDWLVTNQPPTPA